MEKVVKREEVAWLREEFSVIERREEALGARVAVAHIVGAQDAVDLRAGRRPTSPHSTSAGAGKPCSSIACSRAGRRDDPRRRRSSPCRSVA